MNITTMIEQGTANPVLLFATAMLIGALHGLEPGHSKTLIASYIIAIKGSVSKAVLLGTSAALSHSIVVWILAAIALTYGNELIGEELEPWFMIVSGLIVLVLAAWMIFNAMPRPVHHDHDQDHDHDHDHSHSHHHLSEDAHARAHAAELRQRLSSGDTSTWQTIMFGLTGGLIPCPAAITVFILCMHLGQFTLGVTLVGAFSLGLAFILVGVGVVAALGMSAITARTSRIDRIITAAPYVSGVLISLVGLVIIYNGYAHLQAGD